MRVSVNDIGIANHLLSSMQLDYKIVAINEATSDARRARPRHSRYVYVNVNAMV